VADLEIITATVPAGFLFPAVASISDRLRRGFQNEERFSLTGAAHEHLREDSIGGFRAGERKW
jgi:hypothetical protein